MNIKENLLFVAFLLLRNEAVSQSIVTCSCDLTARACNANCCCDPDCSVEEVAVFQCSNETLNEDSRLCVNELVFVNNLPSTAVVETNGLFCIIREQDTSWNSYTEPAILNNETFVAASLQYPTYSYELSTSTSTASTEFYKAGDTIDVIHSNGLEGKFSFPIPGISNKCLDTNPASFMSDQVSSCGRRFVLPDACTTNTFLDPSIYYSFNVSQLPISNATTELPLTVTITDCEGSTRPGIIRNIDNSTCLNVAVSIAYTITYNATSGIIAACISFPQVANITDLSLVQTFSISFVSLNTILNETSTRSGNPGYLIGKPLIIASGSGRGNLTFNPSPISLISPNSNGDGICQNDTKQQINFGEDARTGCLLSFTSVDDCATVESKILPLIDLPSIFVFVATYGNTLLNSTVMTDWIEVSSIGSLPVITGDIITGCVGMPIGVNYNVFFANTGSISNPQPRVIGVQYTPLTKTLRYECFGSNCNVPQNVEISTSVTFIDASSSPSMILKERPTVNARLPSDFFYPFTGTPT